MMEDHNELHVSRAPRLEFSSDSASFSIIIPSCNRPVQLNNCLDSLTRLDFPKSQFEVVVVDDGSASSMESVIESYRSLINITLITQKNAGPGIARNNGVANSRGRFIAFTDDDCKPDRGWLTRLSSQLQKFPDIACGGHISNGLDDNIYSVASQLLVDYLYTYYNRETEHSQFYTSNNMAMARDVFNAVGGFDRNYPGLCGEDRELCDHLRHCGYGWTYVPEAIVYHYHELKFWSFWRQHVNYGGGSVRFRAARARRNQERFKIEPPAFYLNLILCAWKTKLPRPVALTTLLMISQLANALGFVMARFRI
jgi:GT2 family glycosyltransferase